MNVNTATWQMYRTRFLIKAQQLTEPMTFIDALGREQCGKPGDYLVEFSDGRRTIQRRDIFEDIYVPMGPVEENCASGLQPLQSFAPTSRNPTASA